MEEFQIQRIFAIFIDWLKNLNRLHPSSKYLGVQKSKVSKLNMWSSFIQVFESTIVCFQYEYQSCTPVIVSICSFEHSSINKEFLRY
ncbi:hypothetical protein RchiOBHm_Chr1g0340421 [Rosa chinensis]|uniref:Uncharacterized protein n=1 Tax=Rosa chinensis TaxID=74649 RepID=A0A2P6SDF3_ROSCH|nr:hypothetical protein RchiOBHm_Chr1g0340421 [Rosa chinensis]